MAQFSTDLPIIEPFGFNKNGVNGGTSVRAMCTVVAGDFPMEIVWLKDGNKIDNSKFRRIQQLDESTVILSLTQLSLDDSGKYTCFVRNVAGKTSHSADLFVKGALNTLLFPFYIYIFINYMHVFLR